MTLLHIYALSSPEFSRISCAAEGQKASHGVSEIFCISMQDDDTIVWAEAAGGRC